MKRWKKILFLFIAYSITLMHTAVPHQHSQLMPASSYPHAQLQLPGCQSVVDFLQFLFAADLGDNHLEIFKKSPMAAPDLGFAGMLLFCLSGLLLCLALFYPAGRAYAAFRDRLRAGRLRYAAASLRAPPLYI